MTADTTSHTLEVSGWLARAASAKIETTRTRPLARRRRRESEFSTRVRSRTALARTTLNQLEASKKCQFWRGSADLDKLGSIGAARLTKRSIASQIAEGQRTEACDAQGTAGQRG